MTSRIRLKIIEKFGTQERCALAIGLHSSVLSRILRGFKEANEGQINSLAKGLGIDQKAVLNELSNTRALLEVETAGQRGNNR
jgi:hypothetical protein